ncbi:MAG: AsmA-like C-terminal domain-containing protein [Pseudomonadota bacterium]
MRKRTIKVIIISIEVAAVCLAVAAAGAAAFIWRLHQGPVELDAVKPGLAAVLERQLPRGHEVTIGGLELAHDDEARRLLLLVEDFEVIAPDGERASHAPSVTVSLALSDILSGTIGPRTVVADGASFRIVRDEDKNIDVGALGQRRPERKEPASPFARWLSPTRLADMMNNAVEDATITNVKVEFYDVASRRSWTTNDGRLEIKQTPTGVFAVMVGEIAMGASTAEIEATADYIKDSGVVSLLLKTKEAPVGDILSMFYGPRAAVLEAPFTGDASIAFDADGDVLSSHVDAEIGEGVLNLGASALPVKSLVWDANFDPSSNKFEINEFRFDVNGNQGAIDGDVEVRLADENQRTPNEVLFDIKGAETLLNLPGLLPEPTRLDALEASGAYDLNERRLRADRLIVDVLGLRLSGDLDFISPRQERPGEPSSPGVKVNLAGDGALDLESLLRLWPMTTAMGARDWVADRMVSATIDNIDVAVALAPGAVKKEEGMPDDAMMLTFDVRDAMAYYAKTMTPVRAGSGSGALKGNSFHLRVDKARVGDVAIDEGEIVFPVFIPRWQPTYYRFTARGRSDEMLAVLDQEPLRLLQKTNLSPDQFKGDAKAKIEIMRPNKRDVAPEEYQYKGTATFENMAVSGLTGDVDILGARGDIDLKARSLTVTARAALSEAPIDIVWTKNFYRQDGPSSLNVSGTYDSSTGDLFGVSARQVLHGPVAFEAKATGELGALETLKLNADFEQAMMAAPAVGWRKPAGAAATGALDARFDGEEVLIDRLSLLGDGLDVNGTVAFESGGRLKSFAFDRVNLEGAAALKATASPNAAGALQIALVGDYLNAAPFLESVFDGNTGGGDGQSDDEEWGAGLLINARIENVALRNGVVHEGAALDVWRSRQALETLSYTALDHDGPPLMVSLAHTGEKEGPRSAIEARSNNIGSLLAGVAGFTDMEGGEGEMTIDIGDPGYDGLKGVVRARNLRVVEAPLLARIFAAGSLTGLDDLLNNDGISLTDAYGEFHFSDNVLTIDEARATGPSLGITTAGDVHLGEEGAIALSGAVAPLYQVNSILGAAPIIGDILVGKEGEGVFALSYQVDGETAAPAVTVNPLSAITPGIFRNLFDPAQPRGEEEAEPVVPRQRQAPALASDAHTEEKSDEGGFATPEGEIIYLPAGDDEKEPEKKEKDRG